MERWKLVCTPDDIANLKEKLQKMDIIDRCTRERANTKWKFHKLTNLTVFAALLKDVPMGSKNTVLPEPLLRNCNMNCLTFERNTSQLYNDNICLFRAAALHFLATRDWRRKHPKSSTFSRTIVGRRSIKVPGCSLD